METNVFQIEPLDYQQLGNIVDQAVKVKIEPYDIQLNNRCMVRVTLYNQFDIVLITRDIEVSTEEYLQWNEDQFLIDLMLTKIGATLAVATPEGE